MGTQSQGGAGGRPSLRKGLKVGTQSQEGAEGGDPVSGRG